MLDTIFTSLKGDFAVSNFRVIISNLESVLAMIEDGYLVDSHLRNNVIDAIMQFLQTQKK